MFHANLISILSQFRWSVLPEFCVVESIDLAITVVNIEIGNEIGITLCKQKRGHLKMTRCPN